MQILPGNFLYPRKALSTPASLMKRAAAWSISAVEMPGTARSAKRLRISAATSPARRILSISAPRLIGIIRHLLANVVIEAVEDRIASRGPVDLLEQALALIVPRDGESVFVELREAARQRFLGIVVPPNKPAAAFRAWSFAANIMKLPVENRGAIRAGETAGHAFPNDIISQLEEIDNLQRQPAPLETFIERGGLSQSPGKSIKDKPAVFVQPLPDNAQ